MNTTHLSRRNFLKLAAATFGAAALGPRLSAWARPALADFPSAERLGRVCVGKVDLMARPDDASAVVGALFEDAVVPWVHERVGTRPLYFNQRWVETPEGYIYAPYLQPVRNLPNAPLITLPQRGDKAGTWMEVSVPYADIILANPPARSPWLKASTLPRVYYSQILWVDQLYTAMDGTPMYRVNERYGSYGDIFYVPAAALRPMTEEEVAPISPDASDKRVEVDVTYQTMTCYEGNSEVFYARISTGAKFDAEGNAVDKWSTPVGPHPIWRKLLSVHMSGGSTGGGYDLAGIGWTALFSGEGVAIHSTFWHNNFGVPMSHGCVNARPQDAQWVWRWTNPSASLEPGDVTIQGEGSTKVVVVER